MKTENLDKLVISGDVSIRDAMAKLDAGAEGLLLLTDVSGKLMRTVSDGDIRRLLLDGCSIQDSLTRHLPAKEPVVAYDGTNAIDLLSLLNEYVINHVPIIDDEGCLLDLVRRIDLDSQIYLSSPHLGEYERKYVDEALDTNWVAPLGPNVDAFETEMAEYLESDYQAAALSSGTAAIHLSLVLAGIGQGDYVLCSSLTFVASANPILYQGAVPVFIDSDKTSWNISPDSIDLAMLDLSSKGIKPKAIVIVNLYGNSADFEPIKRVCEKWNLIVIEDAAESLGADYQGQKSGTFGDFGIFSFNGNKIITTSGGGMLVSRNPEHIQRAKFLATQARDARPYYYHTSIGYNYRMSNVLAGIGRGQLKVLDERVRRRREIHAIYQEALAEYTFIDWIQESENANSNRWLTAISINAPDYDADKIVATLSAEKIEARHVWRPMHMQPLFDNTPYYSHEDQDVAGKLFATGLCLPSGSNMSESQHEWVIRCLKRELDKLV